MPNMSYCRFQNTAKDLEDCAYHISDALIDDDEKEARERLINICRAIVADVDRNGGE